MIKRFLTSFGVPDLLILILFFSFSFFLMTKTFALDPNGNILIASKAWSDFAATIPLIRSFSFGQNFPPQYPIFAGPPIRYHFIFYLLVGWLEKAGLPLNWALNIPSSLGFSVLLFSIYILGWKLFGKRVVGMLSVIFFLFNGSFSFLEFFKKFPFSPHTLDQIVKNASFPSFGPYDGKIVSAFWNLNIFTNQRHLAISYAAFLFLLFLLNKYSKTPDRLTIPKVLIIGASIGLFPFVHYAVFGMMGILLLVSFMIYPKIRSKIFIVGLTSLLVAIPQVYYMGKSEVSVHLLHPGYLVGGLTIVNFIKYWFLNLGLVSLFAPLGFFLANKDQKKIFVPFLSLFIVGNIFQFSPEIAANHKFFNLFVIGADVFMAFALVKLWKANLPAKVFTVFVFPFLILSGVIDFFPIINDYFITVSDIPQNKAATFIKESTPKDSVFLNSSFLYNPASIAGRKIFVGWPYFAWSAGYDTEKRGRELTDFYTSNDKAHACQFLRTHKLSFFTVEDTSGNRDFPEIDLDFFKNNFRSIYTDGNFRIFSTNDNCP